MEDNMFSNSISLNSKEAEGYFFGEEKLIHFLVFIYLCDC